MTALEAYKVKIVLEDVSQRVSRLPQSFFFMADSDE
jgi:hypothetical protein